MNNRTETPLPVVIAGGGWAGLAAAVELSQAKIPVLVLESARQLGGRARSVCFAKMPVDNGQHLMIGAYSDTLRLLGLVGKQEQETLLRMPLRLQVQGPHTAIDLRTAALLPAPLHLAWGLLTARGLSMSDRFASLVMSTRLAMSHFELAQDCSVAELLKRHRQSAQLVEQLWEPLCLATLNTPIAHASAEVFLRVLHDSFGQSRSDADLLIPTSDLGSIFPKPAFDYIEQQGGLVHLNQRVTSLQIAEGQCQGVVVDGKMIPAQAVVLATSPSVAAQLLDSHQMLSHTHQQLSQFAYEPIVTVYLRYPESCRLELPMQGMSGTLTQWLFDRRVANQPGVMAAVLSSSGPHTALDNATLTEYIIAELAMRHPHWPAPSESLVIREKRATFRCEIGINGRRPSNATSLANLWLAGDYTDTGYPATLEGAVRSGVQCARAIIAQCRQQPFSIANESTIYAPNHQGLSGHS